jgi:hypothetical protein
MKKLILLLVIFKITTSLFSQNYDTITFEKQYNYFVLDTSSQNLWQIGGPHKHFFDNAYSGINAIVTDTSLDYPIKNHSFFDIKIGAFNFENTYPYNIFIELKHKYDTDTLRDGGYITVSYDNGKTWMNIIKDTVYEGVNPSWGSYDNSNGNLYSEKNTLFNGEYGFSGHSSGWVSTWFSWHYIAVKSAKVISDTMVIRFNFISDSIQSNKEGWMIDNIRFYSGDIGGGIETNNSTQFKIYPNPMHLTTTIELNGIHDKTQLDLFDIDGKLVDQRNYSYKQIINLNKDNLKSGLYLLKISTDGKLIGAVILMIK